MDARSAYGWHTSRPFVPFVANEERRRAPHIDTQGDSRADSASDGAIPGRHPGRVFVRYRQTAVSFSVTVPEGWTVHLEEVRVVSDK
jgi:hypothetical protein